MYVYVYECVPFTWLDETFLAFFQGLSSWNIYYTYFMHIHIYIYTCVDIENIIIYIYTYIHLLQVSLLKTREKWPSIFWYSTQHTILEVQPLTCQQTHIMRISILTNAMPIPTLNKIKHIPKSSENIRIDKNRMYSHTYQVIIKQEWLSSERKQQQPWERFHPRPEQPRHPRSTKSPLKRKGFFS